MFDFNKYKDLHKGETCYLFGNGPSIKWFDMSNFSNHIGISCGNLLFHNNFNELDVKYQMLVFPRFFYPKWMRRNQELKNLSTYSRVYSEFISINKDVEFFINLSNFPWKTGKNVNYVHRSMISRKSKLNIIKEIVDPFSGSFHAMLSLAYFMGFSKVYLVGFDAWTIQPARTRRWYELGQGDIYEVDSHEQDFLNILKRHMDIYTVLPCKNNDSCNVQGVDYGELTGEKAKYKENYQISNQNFLKLMESCNGNSNKKLYNIF